MSYKYQLNKNINKQLLNTTFSNARDTIKYARISRYFTPCFSCLLFGDEYLNHNYNLAIFIAVQKYIFESKRFKSWGSLSLSLSLSLFVCTCILV